ncbi:MAG TPA: hypothetical protein VHS78_02690 [Candidatus Elarobacter sp.]|jgi:hypothetical protein|nr:hypothetical protein [Candidatus Elarobacter sp.]
MKLSLPVLALLVATGIPLAACAQQSNAAENGPPPEVRAQMQQARDNARTAAFNDLTPADRAKVQAIITQVNNGQLTDMRAAAQQIDAAITPAEAQAVLAERTKMMQTFRANHPQGAGPNGGPGAGPNGGHRGFGGRNQTAGRFLLQLGVTPEKMHELRQNMQRRQPPNGQ